MKFLSEGSAKDLYLIEEHPDHLAFKFSDRVSVFDYGVLPDLIPHRGLALKRAAIAFEKLFAQNSVPTLFDAALTEKFGEVVQRKVFHPKHMKPGASTGGWQFIPLEIIFRWGVPAGSSYLKRHPELRAYAEFANPKIEFSTKLEPMDRMLSDDEARSLMPAGSSFIALRETARHVAEVLKVGLNAMGLDLWDGKIECAVNLDTSEIALVDAVTPDELRVSLPGLRSTPLSKELLRQWLGPTTWGFEVSRCKRVHGDAWKEKCPTPPSLGEWRVNKISELYLAFATSLESRMGDPLLAWARDDRVKPRVFVTGTGGREAALRWRLEREGCDLVDDAALADAVLLSQDADLARGLTDDLERRRLWVYGASQRASQIEWSKFFGREIAVKSGIRVPRFTKGLSELETFDQPPVVKYDGLAAGKGVVVPQTLDEARAAVKSFAGLGHGKTEIVLEQRLSGVEASAFFGVRTGVQGVECVYLGSARDFKRRLPGDAGPNTGGMGAHAPHPLENASNVELWTNWAQATAKTLADLGRPYNGILYLGLMNDEKSGWNLIEYNARPGDPETQALVLLWPEDQPTLRSLLALSAAPPKAWAPNEADTAGKVVALALVHPQYPEAPTTDAQLAPWSPPPSAELKVFRTASLRGRVAYLVASGATLQEAGDKIFAALVESPWKETLEWRPDILG